MSLAIWGNVKRFVVALEICHNPLVTFLRSFPVDGEVENLLPTCYGLVRDTANCLDMS